jgi:hypothetical protein
MCDYCDCRSHPVIASLSADHGALQGLLDRLGEAVDHDDAVGAATLGRALHALLVAHATSEERGIFAALRASDVDPGYVDHFEDDHRRIHRLVDDLSGPGWRQAAHELGSVLHHHIDREETDLFPAAHQLLVPAQWARIVSSPGTAGSGRSR